MVGIAGAIALGAFAPAAAASHDEMVLFESPGLLVGTSAAVRGQTLTQLASLGVNALRVTLYWRKVAPHPNHRRRPDFNQANPAAYDWSEYAPLIAAAVARHWTVLLTVTGPVPDWATPHGEDEYSDPSTSDFRLFMEAVGRRFGSKVKLISIWNEPNEPGFLRPQYVHGRLASPAVYRGLFLAGYAGLRASGRFSGMKVLMGETSAVGTAGVPAPIAFLRGVLCLNARYRPVGHCAKLPAYGYAQHPYASGGPFGHVPAGDVTIASLGHLVTALNRASRAGAIRADMPIYLTEFGTQSRPNPIGVSLATQAEYDAISERIAYENPRVASFSQYLLRDDHPVHGRTVGSQSGLETYRGVRKPSFADFRLPLTVTQTPDGGGVSFWGLVRPARRSTTVVVQYSTNGGRSWHGLATVRTNAHGYWSSSGIFRRGRVWRVRWTSPSGQTFTGPPIRAYTRSGRIVS